jgi:hypothetical protein
MENGVGRLIEVRIASPIEPQEVVDFKATLGGILGKMSGRVLIAVDLLRANVFGPEVATGFGAIMRSDNPRVERSALLVGEGALFSMQIERLVREAENPARRTFRSDVAMAKWLGEVATPPELERLQRFLKSAG